MRILITGGNGLIGKEIAVRLENEGNEVLRLVREKVSGASEIEWNSETGVPASELAKMENADALLHLAGVGLTEKRWTKKRKKLIYESRVCGTHLIVDALGKLKNPPRVFACASAFGFYGDDCGDAFLTEDSTPGTSFLAHVCRDWEAEANRAEIFGIRVVSLRFGLVLTKKGGALEKLLKPFKLFGTGFIIARGKQYISWIAIEDLYDIFKFVIADKETCGVVNVTSPNPVTNEEFVRAIGMVLSRPVFFHVPAFLLRLILGEVADAILIRGARVIPAKLQKKGFNFRYTTVESALRNLL